jgi:hypothetical protein
LELERFPLDIVLGGVGREAIEAYDEERLRQWGAEGMTAAGESSTARPDITKRNET